MTKQNEQGFGIVGTIVIVLLICVAGIAAWRVYGLRSDTTTKGAPTTTDQQATSNSTAASNAPKSPKIYTSDYLGVSFAYPSDWVEMFTYPNGITLKSPNFQSAGGFSKISSGSTLTVTTSTTSANSTDDSLNQIASQYVNGAPTSSKFVTVADQSAIEFVHSTGENRNKHRVVLFVKDGRQYLIEQQYNLDSENPYDKLLDDVVVSFKFNQ